MADWRIPRCCMEGRKCVFHVNKVTHSDSETAPSHPTTQEAEETTGSDYIQPGTEESEETTGSDYISSGIKEPEETTGSDYISSGIKEPEETAGSDYIHSVVDFNNFSKSDNVNHNTSAAVTAIERGSYEHYWKLMETGNIVVPNCTDIKLMENYVIVLVDEKIIKKWRVSGEMIESMQLKGAGRMCSIKKSTRIAVIQTPSVISCIETHPQLSVVYIIETNHQYTSICHLETYVNAGVGLPNPKHVFATIFTKIRQDTGQLDEFIMRVMPKQDVFGSKKKTPVYTEDASEIQLSQVKKMCCLQSVWRGGIHLIVGCNDSVACIRLTDKTTVWKISLNHSATDVTFMDPNILVCVQDEHRIAAVDYTTGNEVFKNIFDPADAKKVSPHRLSVCGKTMLVKGYSNDDWKMLTIIEHTQ